MHPRYVLILVSVVTLGGLCDAADVPARERYARQLRLECDKLLADVIKRPYGWGWAASPDQARGRTPAISLEPLQTPAAALILWEAGELLKEPRYKDAARQAARLVAAAQQTTGRYPAHATLGPGIMTKEPVVPIADRASTCASLGLMLSLLSGVDDQANEQLVRSARHGATWLTRQQSNTGAWPVMYPPEAAPRSQDRIMRLDTADPRNCAWATALAWNVLSDPLLRLAVERHVKFLETARNPAGMASGANMWGPAFGLAGNAVDNAPQLPPMTDVLATRHVMETTLGIYAVFGQGANFVRAQQAARSLRDLRRTADGQWYRWYTMRGAIHDPPATRSTGAFAPPDLLPPASDFGLAPALATIDMLAGAKHETFIARIESHFSLRAVMAFTLNGFTDGWLMDDLPENAEQLEAFLQRHKQIMADLDQPAGEELDSRLRKLFALLVRSKIEKRLWE